MPTVSVNTSPASFRQYYDDGNYPAIPEVFASFEEVDEALYNHLRAYYYHTARGMVYKDFSPAWHNRRRDLELEWARLCPYTPKPVRKPTLWERFRRWLFS